MNSKLYINCLYDCKFYYFNKINIILFLGDFMNIEFKDLPMADLVPGYIYEGGRREDGHRGRSGEVLSKLLGVDNAGGFRKKRIEGRDDGYAFIALALRGDDPLWPNEFDENTGKLKYYGDNKEGTDFLSTGKKGNLILKQVFDKLIFFNILDIPPFFAFQRISGEDLKFLGLAVPGHPDIPPSESLKLYRGQTRNGKEFLNYESYFTILDTGEESISREWIKSLVEDNENNLRYAPTAWKNFIEKGREGIKPLEVIHHYENRGEKNGCNKLYYGVPGSGKSHEIKKVLNDIPESQKERVLFHPDYTYSDFIGQILPKVENGDISYPFTPGPFTRILEKAFHDPDDSYYLIIEEINRGNAPAIFGDIFQLLDRVKEKSKNDFGNSEYSITNSDIAKYIYNKSELEEYGDKIRIPSNLSIYATMNTSDQNVFTLDTAFQRRWEMEMIKNNWDDEKVKFPIKGININWDVFGKGMNELIIEKNKHGLSSEDKRLGAYFIKKEDLIMGDEEKTEEEIKKLFAEKVLKYLWDDAFKFHREDVFDEKEVEQFTLEFFLDKFTNKETDENRFSIFTNEARSYIGLDEKSDQGQEDEE